MTVTETRVVTEEAGLSQAERVVDVFIAPSKTFADLRRSASWWLPFLLLVVVTLASAFVVDRKVGFERVAENVVHQSPKQEERMSSLTAEQRAAQYHNMSSGYRVAVYGSFVFVLVFVAAAALLYWATVNFGLGASTSYGQHFALWMYASLPKLVAGIIGIVTLLVGADPETYNLQNPVGTNPAYYMPDGAPWLRSLLSFFDVLSLWQLVLLTIGLALVARISTGKAAAGVFVWWVLGMVVSVGIAAATS